MATTEINVKENGPCIVAGSVTYTDADGNEKTTSGKAVALCRCGASNNKPFCDGEHRAADFEATGVVLQLQN